jgi:hypothetical protein
MAHGQYKGLQINKECRRIRENKCSWKITEEEIFFRLFGTMGEIPIHY